MFHEVLTWDAHSLQMSPDFHAVCLSIQDLCWCELALTLQSLLFLARQSPTHICRTVDTAETLPLILLHDMPICEFTAADPGMQFHLHRSTIVEIALVQSEKVRHEQSNINRG